jgi:D-arabinose 1-dehydrogenase-like Zn-dependent alcohol dehydrogenase
MPLILGATHAFNGTNNDLASKIRDVTSGHGVNASFDFVGNDATLALAIGATRSLGNATLWGTVEELREVIALAESGELTPIPIERSPLERINEVYARLKRGEIQGRAVITPAA